jgi:hypothetical protein
MNILKAIHYKRNWKQRKDVSPTLESALGIGYLPFEGDNCYHTMGTGQPDPKKNVKLTKRKGVGSCEQVFDLLGILVTDPINMGTFNFFDSSRFPVAHLIFDVFPYILWGNCKEDPTTISERLARHTDKPIR